MGEWLNRGEALIYASDDIPTELNEEAAQVLSQKIDEHKAFFSDWNSVKEQASRIAPTLQVLFFVTILCKNFGFNRGVANN